MRLRVINVNVRGASAVPHRGWIARLYFWACEYLYDEFATHYDLVSWLVSGGQWRSWQAGVWEEVNGERVLELGCGIGAMLVEGTLRGLHMVGLDRSPAMLALAQRRVNFAHSDAKLLCGDGMASPLGDMQFDTVMATFPAGYILAPETLAEVGRVVRVGGKFVVLGLWVEVHIGIFTRLVPVFYGPLTDAMCHGIEQRMNAAGFRMRWIAQRKGLFTVGGFVAEKMEHVDGRA